MTTRYWIGVASKEHVMRGVQGGFCQLCHGKAYPLKRMSPGDWIIYYSSKEKFNENIGCQQFTAIGKILNDKVYEYQMSPDFIPYRRDVEFIHDAKSVPIQPLIPSLSFIKTKSSWGYVFRFGHLEIPEQDFLLIKKEMINHK